MKVNNPALTGLFLHHFTNPLAQAFSLFIIRFTSPGLGCGREALKGVGTGFTGEKCSGRGFALGDTPGEDRRRGGWMVDPPGPGGLKY